MPFEVWSKVTTELDCSAGPACLAAQGIPPRDVTQGPALEQGTATGAVITQGCPCASPWGQHPQECHVAPQMCLIWDEKCCAWGEKSFGSAAVIFLHPFYNPKIIPKFPNSLRASLHSDFILQSSLGRDLAFSIFPPVRIPLRQCCEEFWLRWPESPS